MTNLLGHVYALEHVADAGLILQSITRAEVRTPRMIINTIIMKLVIGLVDEAVNLNIDPYFRLAYETPSLQLVAIKRYHKTGEQQQFNSLPRLPQYVR